MADDNTKATDEAVKKAEAEAQAKAVAAAAAARKAEEADAAAEAARQKLNQLTVKTYRGPCGQHFVGVVCEQTPNGYAHFRQDPELRVGSGTFETDNTTLIVALDNLVKQGQIKNG